MPGSDNSLTILPSPDVLAEPCATDHDGTAHHQYVKMEWGPDNTYNKVDDVFGLRLPVRSYPASASATASVGIGANLSGAVDCRGYDPVGITVPSTFDGTQINFQVSMDNSNFFPLYDSTNSIVQMTVTASRAYLLWGELYGWNYIKVNCVTAQATTSTDFVIQLRA